MGPSRYWMIWCVFATCLLWDVLLLMAVLVSQGHGFFTLPRGTMLRDFGFFWGGARLALDGAVNLVFDPPAFNAWLATQVAPGSMHGPATWSYPPTTLLVLAPFGLLSAPLALIVWDGLQFLLLGMVLARLFQEWRIVVAVLLSPAALYSLQLGQNGPLAGTLIISGLWLAERRPWLAGICIGLLVIKPQLALLFPFAFAAARMWKCFAAAVFSASGLILMSLLAFGADAWAQYFYHTLPYMTTQLSQPYGATTQFAMPTPFVTLLGWGMLAGWAMGLQWITTAIVVLLVVCAWRRDTLHSRKLTCGAIMLATPYALVYDMIPMMLSVALCARATTRRRDVRPVEAMLLAGLWMLPAITPLTYLLNIRPIGAPVILLFVLYQFYRVNCHGSAVLNPASR